MMWLNLIMVELEQPKLAPMSKFQKVLLILLIIGFFKWLWWMIGHYGCPP